MFDDVQQSNAPSNLPIGDPNDMFEKVGEDDISLPVSNEETSLSDAIELKSALGSGVLQPKQVSDSLLDKNGLENLNNNEVSVQRDIKSIDAENNSIEDSSTSTEELMTPSLTNPISQSSIDAEPKDMFNDIDPAPEMGDAKKSLVDTTTSSISNTDPSHLSQNPVANSGTALGAEMSTNLSQNGVAIHKAATTGPKVAKILILVVFSGVFLAIFIFVGLPMLLVLLSSSSVSDLEDKIYTPDGSVLGEINTSTIEENVPIFDDGATVNDTIDLFPEDQIIPEETNPIDVNTSIDESIIFGESIDTDGDGLTDVREIDLGTDSKNWDTDGDDLSDGDEVIIWKTDPKNPDTDGDSFKDGQEIKGGYNPLGSGKLFELPNN